MKLGAGTALLTMAGFYHATRRERCAGIFDHHEKIRSAGTSANRSSRFGCRTLLSLKGAGLDVSPTQQPAEQHFGIFRVRDPKTRTLENRKGAAPRVSIHRGGIVWIATRWNTAKNSYSQFAEQRLSAVPSRVL